MNLSQFFSYSLPAFINSFSLVIMAFYFIKINNRITVVQNQLVSLHQLAFEKWINSIVQSEEVINLENIFEDKKVR